LINKYKQNSCNAYNLRSEGDDITYSLNDNNLYDNEFNSSYIRGNSIKFVWNGNRFERKKVTKEE